MQDIPNSIPNNGNNAGNKRIAMLIDGDNAQASLIEKMVAETSKYGLVTIRRVYGDWTTTQMKSWKDVLSISPISERTAIWLMPFSSYSTGSSMVMIRLWTELIVLRKA